MCHWKVRSPENDGLDDDSLKFGIADGGHTFQVIKETIQHAVKLKENNEDWTEPFVRVHFISGNRINLGTDEEIVEALNTSSSVQPVTIDEYKGEFDELKEALRKAGFDVNLVAWRENEIKEWHVLEIIQRMACFLKDRWITTQPASMYKSKTKALGLYINENSRKEFRRLYDVIVDVITFPEFVQQEFSGDEVGINKRSHGKLKAVKLLSKAQQRPGTEYVTEHKMDMAALLPMAAAFREVLRLKGDRYQWRLDPKDMFRRCAKDLHQILVLQARKARVTSQLGSDMEYWGACVHLVMRTMTTMQDESNPAV